MTSQAFSRRSYPERLTQPARLFQVVPYNT
uniref:Uncharacterized protein n=1 Tax=Anguilla anguilla TaxID=7936 RepID=A0A0E9P6A1_ANGAN